MPSRVGCGALVIAVCSMGVSSAARAQLRVDVGATIGQYSPLGSFDKGSAQRMNVPNSPGDLAGTAFGGELRVWIVPRIGIGFDGSTVSSRVGGGTTPGGYVAPTGARVSTGSAQLLFRVTSDESRARVWLSAGGGLVKHGGDAYVQFGEPTNFAGVFGVGSAIRLAGALHAELGVTTMFYNVNMSGTSLAFGPGLFERGSQTDLMLRTGLSYTIH